MAEAAENLMKLPLDALWRAKSGRFPGAKFAPFAGYDMPVQFEGVIAEHNWTRAHAGLFDVSHMGPCSLDLYDEDLAPEASRAAVSAMIEKLVPADIVKLKPGQMRYTTLLNADGGVLDDLMIARDPEPAWQGRLYLVVNAGAKEEDYGLLQAAAGEAASLKRYDDAMTLLALQGPEAGDVLRPLLPASADMKFMSIALMTHGELGDLVVTRSGYTGEDGFEILIGNARAEDLARTLLADARVKPIGLGARDSLRLEAGLSLYGHDLDPTISPIEADLAWTIGKRRREAGDFPGAARILRELREGPSRKRVGIRPKDRAPAREGVEIMKDGRRIGAVTSGGFSPTLNAPISMGYVEARFAAPGTGVDLIVRNQPRAAEIVALPFVPHRYVR